MTASVPLSHFLWAEGLIQITPSDWKIKPAGASVAGDLAANLQMAQTKCSKYSGSLNSQQVLGILPTRNVWTGGGCRCRSSTFCTAGCIYRLSIKRQATEKASPAPEHSDKRRSFKVKLDYSKNLIRLSGRELWSLR